MVNRAHSRLTRLCLAERELEATGTWPTVGSISGESGEDSLDIERIDKSAYVSRGVDKGSPGRRLKRGSCVLKGSAPLN